MVVAFSASEGNVEDNLLPGSMSNGNVVYEEELGDDEEEEENVTVEYSNLQSMRISVDEFLRSFPDRKANSVLEEEFKVNKYLSKVLHYTVTLRRNVFLYYIRIANKPILFCSIYQKVFLNLILQH